VRLLEALDCALGPRPEQAVDWTGAVAETPQAALKLSNGLGAVVGRVSRPARERFVGGEPRRGNEEQHGRGQQAGQPSPKASTPFTGHLQVEVPANSALEGLVPASNSRGISPLFAGIPALSRGSQQPDLRWYHLLSG